jgi:hypothetical protein
MSSPRNKKIGAKTLSVEYVLLRDRQCRRYLWNEIDCCWRINRLMFAKYRPTKSVWPVKPILTFRFCPPPPPVRAPLYSWRYHPHIFIYGQYLHTFLRFDQNSFSRFRKNRHFVFWGFSPRVPVLGAGMLMLTRYRPRMDRSHAWSSAAKT